MGRLAAGVDGPVAGPGSLGHECPPAGRVLPADPVIQVGQVQVVGELMGENADTTVLSLDGVVADPVAGVADLDAAEWIEVRSGDADQVVERIPAMAPDGILAER